MTLSSQTLFGNTRQIGDVSPSIEVLWTKEKDDHMNIVQHISESDDESVSNNTASFRALGNQQ